MIRHIGFGVAAFALAGAVAWSKPPAPSAGKPAAAGRMIYDGTGCAECHGYAGQGGSAGPRLAGKALAVEAFSRQLRHPVEEMPPYSEKVIDADQLVALHAYVADMK